MARYSWSAPPDSETNISSHGVYMVTTCGLGVPGAYIGLAMPFATYELSPCDLPTLIWDRGAAATSARHASAHSAVLTSDTIDE
jgi:hypothetical protein